MPAKPPPRPRAAPARTPQEIESYLEMRLTNASDQAERARFEAALSRHRAAETRRRILARVLLVFSGLIMLAITLRIYAMAVELHHWSPRL